MLPTARSRHAAARLLQQIGELMVTRRLSMWTKRLAPDFDFEAFETVRDGFTHPELHGWNEIIERLLSAGDNTLRVIMGEIHSELHPRLQDLVARRWPKDHDYTWSRLYADERTQLNRQPSTAQPQPTAPRGQTGKKPSKAERVAARRQQEEARAQQRAAQATTSYVGFEHTRQLFRELKSLYTPHEVCLPVSELVRLANQALQNIHDFLAADPVLRPQMRFPEGITIEEWKQAQPDDATERFNARLLMCPELLYAIEYNAGQLTNLLGRLSDCPEAETIMQHHEPLQLRRLRNYIEHGHALIDRPDAFRIDTATPDLLRARHKIIGPYMVQLIITLLPTLRKLNHSLNHPAEDASA
jgi:hypothetical protein